MAGLTFDADRHQYAMDGVPVWRSVTGVLRAAGAIDFSGVHPGALETARRRGSTVHQAIHFFNEHDLDEAAFRADYPDYQGYLDAWQEFLVLRRFDPVLNEHRVYSRRYDVAGTIDCLGWLDGQAALIDFATGRPQDAAKDLQTAAYLTLAVEWKADDPFLAAFFTTAGAPFGVRRFAVALRRDGSFQLEPYGDPRDLRAFVALVEAQRIIAQRKRAPVDADQDAEILAPDVQMDRGGLLR